MSYTGGPSIDQGPGGANAVPQATTPDRIDPCTIIQGSTTVTDSYCLASDVGKTVNGTGIPNSPTQAIILSVIPGVQFTMSVAATVTGVEPLRIHFTNQTKYGAGFPTIPGIPSANAFGFNSTTDGIYDPNAHAPIENFPAAGSTVIYPANTMYAGGVKADSATDDTAAWTAVFAAVPAAGAIIIPPAGTSLIDPGVLYVPNGTYILGGGSFGFGVTATTGTMFQYVAATPANITFEQVTFDCRGARNIVWFRPTSVGNSHNPAPGVTWFQCVFTSTSAVPSNNQITVDYDGSNNRIEECFFTNVGQVNIGAYAASAGYNNVIRSNVFQAGTSIYMKVIITETSSNVVIADNIFDSIISVYINASTSASTGIGSGQMITNNIAQNLTNQNVRFINVFQGAVVSGNVLANCTISTSLYLFNCVGGGTNNQSQVVFTNNIVFNCTFSAIFTIFAIDSEFGIILANNMVYGNTGAFNCFQLSNIDTSSLQEQLITGNIFVCSTTTSSSIGDCSNSGATALRGNRFENFGAGITFNNGNPNNADFQLQGNTFVNIAGTIVITSTSNTFSHLLIEGNDITQPSFSGSCFFIYYANDVVIANNNITTGCSGYVIAVYFCTRGFVQGNKIYATVQSTAVIIDSSSTGILVANNVCSGAANTFTVAATTSHSAGNNYYWNGGTTWTAS